MTSYIACFGLIPRTGLHVLTELSLRILTPKPALNMERELLSTQEPLTHYPLVLRVHPP